MKGKSQLQISKRESENFPELLSMRPIPGDDDGIPD
jgi:hypothetical protein